MQADTEDNKQDNTKGSHNQIKYDFVLKNKKNMQALLTEEHIYTEICPNQQNQMFAILI